MKHTQYICTLGLLLSSWLAMAQDGIWCLVTDSGQRVAMADVKCLAAADDDSTFAVVLTDGRTIDGVRRATFARATPTAINQVSSTIFNAHNMISLSNLPNGTAVTILSTDGKIVFQGSADGDLDISTLPTGVYVVRVGGTSFKFRKR